MGFFSTLKMIAGNMLEVKNLDMGSDIFIATICGFEPLHVSPSIKRPVSEHVKNLYLNNLGPKLTVEDIALSKLTLYAMAFNDGSRDCKEIRRGIEKMLSMGENSARGDIRLDARMVLAQDGWGE